MDISREAELLRSKVFVPLGSNGSTLGFLSLGDKVTGRPFEDIELENLFTFARHIGSAVNNARAYEKLQARSQNIEDVLTGITDGIVAVNTDGIVIAINKAAGKLLNVTPGQISGKSVQRLGPEYAKIFDSSVHNDTTYAEEEVDDISRRLKLRVTTSLLKDEHGSCIGAVMLLNKRSLEERSELKGFTKMMNHHIRNAVTSISAFDQLVREDYDEESLLDRMDKLITNPSDALIATVEKLSDYAASSSFVPAKWNLKMIIEEIIDDLMERYGEGIVEITFEWEAADPMVVGDASRLSVAIGKVIENGIEAVKDKADGVVAIIIRDHPGGSESEANNLIEISVVDNGVGMHRDEINNAFELFYTTKWTTGLGLGLPTARKTIENHGGLITITSRKGEGTIAKVLLERNQ
jgi:two-component system nitrogen regulation sensor histidine kinase NtrY